LFWDHSVSLGTRQRWEELLQAFHSRFVPFYFMSFYIPSTIYDYTQTPQFHESKSDQLVRQKHPAAALRSISHLGN
jgi:hypothetical protein